MVEAIAIAAGPSGSGVTTSTLALGMALAEKHDVTVLDPAAGSTELLAASPHVDGTLQDVLCADGPSVDAISHERHGVRLLPCGTTLHALASADSSRIRDVFATIAADTDLLLIDSPALLESAAPTLPIVLADRAVVVLEPTTSALSDGLQVDGYATVYGTDVAGVLLTRVGDSVPDHIVERAERYFDAPVLGQIPESSVVREATDSGHPLLAHAPNSAAADAYRAAAGQLTIQDGDPADISRRARSAIRPQQPP
ncbi:chromosome partitioning protein ParA [Haloglomus halophilum]|uniref:nucleotide-binding protein n=1 Tax=Haloglomus halophilum TaxID=2962672 RepID=UPI0020C9BC86|nr:chromosome partitioning protein ParA [Haloglomus halophilum]